MACEGVNKKEEEATEAADCNFFCKFTIKLLEFPVQIGLSVKFPSKKLSESCEKQEKGIKNKKNSTEFFIRLVNLLK
jgi:hypothetical protein